MDAVNYMIQLSCVPYIHSFSNRHIVAFRRILRIFFLRTMFTKFISIHWPSSMGLWNIFAKLIKLLFFRHFKFLWNQHYQRGYIRRCMFFYEGTISDLISYLLLLNRNNIMCDYDLIFVFAYWMTHIQTCNTSICGIKNTRG